MTTQALNNLADKVVIANATGNEALYNGAVSELLAAVRALATVSDAQPVRKLEVVVSGTPVLMEVSPDKPLVSVCGAAFYGAGISITSGQWLFTDESGSVLDEDTPISEVKSARVFLSRAAGIAAASTPSPSPVSVQPSDEQMEKARDAVAEALGDAYDCTRVWSAWSYETMTRDDFSLVAEDSDRLAEITDAAIKAILSTQPAQPISSEAPDRFELQAKGKHPAPCARHCEANAFNIEIRQLKAQLAASASPAPDVRPSEMELRNEIAELRACLDMVVDEDSTAAPSVPVSDEQIIEGFKAAGINFARFYSPRTKGNVWCTTGSNDAAALISAVRALLASQPAAPVQQEPVEQVLRSALAWGMVYGPSLSGDQWEEMREVMVRQFAARIAVPAVQETPQQEAVAWMRTNRKECVTAESKRQMENTDFGSWKEVAASYTIPLVYAAPAAAPVLQEPVTLTDDEIVAMSSRAGLPCFNDEHRKRSIRLVRDALAASHPQAAQPQDAGQARELPLLPGYVTVPIRTLEMISAAMNHMGDVLNNMDAVEEEDEEKTGPAFDAIREILGVSK